MDYSKMTLKEKVFQTFIVTVREISTHGGTEKFFKNYPVAGIYYNLSRDPNIKKSPEMGTSTYRERIEECRKASSLPLLVCADGSEMVGQKNIISYRSLAGAPNEEEAYLAGKAVGMQLNATGVDWLLGPAIDVYYDRAMPFLAMSDNFELSAKIFGKVVEGLQDQGILATIKHFPGLGTNKLNMHFCPGKNTLDFDEWMRTYGMLYKSIIDKGVWSVMTTHTTLESYDNEIHDGFYPIATYSHKLSTELLKGKLGFNGGIVTDALIMGGMATGDLIAETVQAFKAGADLLLWPPVEAADVIVEKLESGEIPMQRLDDALERIGRMRDFREKALTEKSYDTPDLEFVEDTASRIMKNGICEYKNELNLLPFDESVKKILLIDVTPDENAYQTVMVKEELESRGFSVDIQKNIYDNPSRVCWQDDIDKLQSGFDMVIFNINTSYSTDWNIEYMLVWASHLFDKKKKVIVNFGAPFFAIDYFPEDKTIIEMNTSPSRESIKHLVDGLVGKIKFSGKYALTNKKFFSSIK